MFTELYGFFIGLPGTTSLGCNVDCTELSRFLVKGTSNFYLWGVRAESLISITNDVMIWIRFSRYWCFVEGNLSGFPSQRTSNAGFDIFIYVRLNKALHTQTSCPWFETPWWQYGVILMKTKWHFLTIFILVPKFWNEYKNIICWYVSGYVLNKDSKIMSSIFYFLKFSTNLSVHIKPRYYFAFTYGFPAHNLLLTRDMLKLLKISTEKN